MLPLATVPCVPDVAGEPGCWADNRPPEMKKTAEDRAMLTAQRNGFIKPAIFPLQSPQRNAHQRCFFMAMRFRDKLAGARKNPSINSPRPSGWQQLSFSSMERNGKCRKRKRFRRLEGAKGGKECIRNPTPGDSMAIAKGSYFVDFIRHRAGGSRVPHPFRSESLIRG